MPRTCGRWDAREPKVRRVAGAIGRLALSSRGRDCAFSPRSRRGGRVSHEGDEHRATPGVMTYGAPAVGNLLAQRYQLDEHIDTDATGRQIWRGTDVVLRRPVAIVVREPGGEAAQGMLTVAVAISRLVHPHLVSVYDAIDEGNRA